MKSKLSWISKAKRTLDPYLKKAREMELWIRAESLAFHTVLAVIPILGFAFWLIARLGLAETWAEEIKTYVFTHLTVVSGDRLTSTIEGALDSLRSKNVGLVGVGFLFYSSLKLILEFGAAQDKILKVKAADETPITLSFIALTARRAGIMLVLPIVLATTIFVTDWIQRESWIRTVLELEHIGPFVALPLAWSVGIAAFSFVYYFVPRRRVLWASALRAALVVVPALEITRFLVAWANRYAVTTHEIYGVFAVLPLTLFWVQIGWTIILSGGTLLKIRR